ncbi:MAG: 4-alpha-glucanotransferase [Christensenellaceae bacterium]|jgi:4-alpha-glucanotransferase
MVRGNGILLHISSLPSCYGIGSLGKPAYEFVDALYEARQKYWQILPCTPTEKTNNPYKSLSAFASNPLFIDVDLLAEEGLLEKNDLKALRMDFDPDRVEYARQYALKGPLLQKAYENGINRYKEEFLEYKAQNVYWITDYSLFMAITNYFSHPYFERWDADFRLRDPATMLEFSNKLAQEIEYIEFLQFLYDKQWQALKKYANDHEISIIGDIPIYVAPDSADVWARPELFSADDLVSGTPPDLFSKEGQYWGNPIYNWEYLESTDYEWWHRRLQRNMELYDITRVDHFRGFESYYAIPKGGHPKDGRWIKCPGEDMFRLLRELMGNDDLPIMVEDLGSLNEEVFAFIKRCGFRGTKVLQFAFDQVNSMYLPHNYTPHSVVYTGTHDNNTTKGWFKELSWPHKVLLREYIGDCNEDDIAWKLIRLAMQSVSEVCIIPMQDILSMGTEARMNYPSIPEGNWEWRMRSGAFDRSLRKQLKNMTRITGRGR